MQNKNIYGFMLDADYTIYMCLKKMQPQTKRTVNSFEGAAKGGFNHDTSTEFNKPNKQ